jgi:signal recognition particle subunit SRP54
MMMWVAKGGSMPGVPGGMSSGGKRGRAKRAAKSKQGKGRRVSGGPAKATQQAKAADAKAASAATPSATPATRDRLREGRGVARPAEGLLEVPQVSSREHRGRRQRES